jgi:hypothetical protein
MVYPLRVLGLFSKTAKSTECLYKIHCEIFRAGTFLTGMHDSVGVAIFLPSFNQYEILWKLIRHLEQFICLWFLSERGTFGQKWEKLVRFLTQILPLKWNNLPTEQNIAKFGDFIKLLNIKSLMIGAILPICWSITLRVLSTCFKGTEENR